MKKILGSIGLVLVLSIFGFTQTAVAFERDAREGHASKELRQSPPRGGSGAGFREDHSRQEVRFQKPVHYERHLPAGYRTLKIANRVLYYLNGIFYQSTPYGYEVVTAPMGAILRELPHGYYQILYGGTAYYVYNNTYYIRGAMGYNIVTPPPQVVMFPFRAGW